MSELQRKQSSCYCVNLRWAANTLTTKYDAALKPAGITLAQFSLLTGVERLDGCTTTDLARYSGLERTTVVRNLKSLFQKELILDVSEEGKRNRNIKLTEKGKDTLRTARPLWQHAQKEVEDSLGSELAKMIYKLSEQL